MNVLNVQDVERELAARAARAIHPEVVSWVKTVARNYLLGKLTEKDIESNYRVYDPAKLDPIMPRPDKLPAWAKEALKRGEPLHWFDWAQTNRRILWQTLDMTVLWFNTFKSGDTRLRRCDRINFETAAKAGALWFKDVNENVWSYIKDKPPVVLSYDDGAYRWVRLVNALHFEREGKLMGHCVGNGNYFESWRNGKRQFYSLRDKQNNPHCTIEMDPVTEAVLQCKGRSNHKPGPTYQPHIRRFITDMKWAIHGDAHFIDLK